MKHRFVLLSAFLLASPAHAGEQCVWPFRESPADVTARMKADLGSELKAQCPAQELVAVTFALPVGKTPRHVVVSAPRCKSVEPAIARWVKARQPAEFMAFERPQDVAFKIAMRFSS